MCFYDGESCDMYSSKTQKARKPHRCECCCNVIPVGSLYEHGRGIWEGEWFSIDLCGSCLLLRYIVHIHELADGCRHYESWAPMNDELFEAAENREIPVPTNDLGQRFLRYIIKRVGYLNGIFAKAS